MPHFRAALPRSSRATAILELGVLRPSSVICGPSATIRHFGIRCIIQFICLPEFCINIVLNFSWDNCIYQDKLKTILMQNVALWELENSEYLSGSAS